MSGKAIALKLDLGGASDGRRRENRRRARRAGGCRGRRWQQPYGEGGFYATERRFSPDRASLAGVGTRSRRSLKAPSVQTRAPLRSTAVSGNTVHPFITGAPNFTTGSPSKPASNLGARLRVLKSVEPTLRCRVSRTNCGSVLFYVCVVRANTVKNQEPKRLFGFHFDPPPPSVVATGLSRAGIEDKFRANWRRISSTKFEGKSTWIKRFHRTRRRGLLVWIPAMCDVNRELGPGS
ncbi:hypothetical protein MRX96_022157 [Rhipicephalus microplus]